MRLIECRRCDSPYCDGCNVFTLATMLHEGKMNCLMDEHHSVTIDPESLRKKGEWIYNTDDFTPKKRCTNCGYNKPLVAGEAIKQEPDNFCPNCGADMRGET